MKSFLALIVVVFLAIGIGVAVEGATGPSAKQSSPTENAVTQGDQIPATGPCPDSLHVTDVQSSDPATKIELLPKGAMFGVICRYSAQLSSTAFKLVRSSLINGRTTSEFQSVITSMNTKKPQGVFACPAEFLGTVILAFGYANRSTVDLWYNNTGCETLDNGYLKAFQQENPGMFNQLNALVTRLSPQPST